MLRQGAYAVLVGLVGAGIVHIVILLRLPAFSERDAWSNLAARAPLYQVARISDRPGAPALLQSPDPFVDAVACRFDLTEGIAHLSGPGGVPFWSASVYDRNGQNIYSFTDRTATSGALDFVVATPIQMTEVRKALPQEFRASVFVEAPLEEGIVVIRSLVPDESYRPEVAAFLDGIACRSVLPEPAGLD